MVSRVGSVRIDWEECFSDQNIQNAVRGRVVESCLNLFTKELLSGNAPARVKLTIGCRFIRHLPSKRIEKVVTALDLKKVWPSSSLVEFELHCLLVTELKKAIQAENLAAVKVLFSKVKTFNFSMASLLDLILEHFDDQELITSALEISAWKTMSLGEQAFFLQTNQEPTTYRIPMLRCFAKLLSIIPTHQHSDIMPIIQSQIGSSSEFNAASEPEQVRLIEELSSFVTALRSMFNSKNYLQVGWRQLLNITSKRRAQIAKAVKMIGFNTERDLKLNFTSVAKLPDQELDERINFLKFAKDCIKLIANAPSGFRIPIKRSIVVKGCDLDKLSGLCQQYSDPLSLQPSTEIENIKNIILSISGLEAERRRGIWRALAKCQFLWSQCRYSAFEFFCKLSNSEIEAIVNFYTTYDKFNIHGSHSDSEELLNSLSMIPSGELLDVMECGRQAIPQDQKFKASYLIDAVRNLPQETRKSIVNELQAAMKNEDFNDFIFMLSLFSPLKSEEVRPIFEAHRSSLISLREGISLELFAELKTIPEATFSKLAFWLDFPDLDLSDLDLLGWEGVQKMAEAVAQSEDLEEIDFYMFLEEIFSDRNFQERTLRRLSDRLDDESQSLHFRYCTALEIVNYDFYLGLHFEHELYQKALEVVSTCDPDLVNNPKFPITLFKNLLHTVPNESWITFDVPRETVKLKCLDTSREDRLVLKSIPVEVSWDVDALRAINDWKGFTQEHLKVLLQGFNTQVNFNALSSLIKKFEKHLKKMTSEERKSVYDQIESNYGLAYRKIKKRLLHPQLRKWLTLDEKVQSIPTTSFQLIAIVRFLIESKDEAHFLGFGASIGNCDTGQADGISNYYTNYLPMKYKIKANSNEHEAVDYVQNLFKAFFQDELNKVFAGEELSRMIVGNDSLEEMSHFAAYLRNRFYRQAGLEHQINLDHHSGVLNDKLLHADPKWVLECIYKLFSFEIVYKKMFEYSTKFLENFSFYPGIQSLICRGKPGAKEGITEKEFIENREKYFLFDEDDVPLRLTPEGLFKALKALDWIHVHTE